MYSKKKKNANNLTLSLVNQLTFGKLFFKQV